MAPEKRGSLVKVVVVGGNGFLGHHIINQALDSWSCSSVASIDLRCDKNRRDKATYHECDITDAPKLAALVAQLSPDVIIHTASPLASGESKTANALFDKVNVGGTQSVVDACRAAKVKALVYTSSASVISDMRSDLLNADERWPVLRAPQQKEYYSETKAAAEEIVLKANRAESSNLLTAAIRPAGIFGEGDVQLLPGFMRAYRTNKSNFQLGDNDNIFDYTYVGNVAHAHLLAAQRLLATAAAKTAPLDYERVDGEPFFITNDEPVYFWDFARAVWRAAGNQAGTQGVWVISREVSKVIGFFSEVFCSIIQKPPTFTVQRANISTMTRYYNITKARTVLGYEPLWTLQQAVERGVAWFTEQEKSGAIKL